MIANLSNYVCKLLQLSARPDRGFGGNGGNQSTNIDSISLQSGSVNVQIPLASLPPVAGGELSYTLTAFYNSKLWDSHQSEIEGQTQNVGCYPRFSTQDIWQSDQAGWRIGGQYQIFFRDAHDDYDYMQPSSLDCYGHDFYYMQGRFFKPMLRMPDGSEHELRIQGYWETYSSLGDRAHLKGYYKQSSGAPGNPPFNSPVRMYTIDGTYITAIVNPSSYSISSTIYMKDGTRIESSADGQRTIDTNGNSILSGGRLINNGTVYEQFVKDEQTGREIKWSQSTYNGQSATKIEYQTVGGAWQNTFVVWGNTTVQGKVYTKESWDMNASGGNGDHCAIEVQMPNVSFNVIREIILPVTEQGVAPQKFTFGYNSDSTISANTQSPRWTCGGQTFPDYTRNASVGWGELSDVTTPVGAHIKYNYSNEGLHDFIGMTGTVDDVVNDILRDVITSKVVTHDGTTDTWQYAVTRINGNYITAGQVVNPDGSFHSEFYYPSNIAYSGTYGTIPQGYINGLGGLTYKTVESGQVTTLKKWILLGGATPAIGAPSNGVGINSVVDTEYTILTDTVGNNPKMSAKKFQYDYNGELIKTIQYDWFSPSSVTYGNDGVPLDVPANAPVLRVTNNSYYNQALNASSGTAYQNRTLGGSSTIILGALQESKIGDGTTDKSITQFSYDNQAYNTVPTKGNLTKVSVSDDTNNQWINSLTGYDNYGNVVSKTDPKGNLTQIFYEDNTHAMPTKIIVDPQNGTGQQITTRTYDYYTGLPLTSTDINGNTSSIDYMNNLLGAVDPFGRAGTTYSPYIEIDGVNKRLTSKTYYEDGMRKTRVESDLYNEGDAILKARETRDQMGRTVLTEKNENGANAYSVSSQTVYKTLERVVLSSNPTRNDNSPTDGWTRATSDILGRRIEVATFSGAAQPPISGTNANWTGSVTTAYSANMTTVTDQAGKKRRSIVNGLGQLTRVDEPNEAGQFDAGGVPVQPTNYQYDVLGNLTQAQQVGTTAQQCGDTTSNCTQIRTFVYDSLSRLKQTINPESGTIFYTYDLNGNVQTKTDAMGIKTIHHYDGLNRLIKRCYTIPNPQGSPTSCNELTATTVSPNTLSVTYTYDNLTNAKGKLTKIVTGDVSTPFSVTDYQSFDKFGRVTQSQQTTDGMTSNANYVPMTYKYNLAGALIEQKYPSGRIVKNTLEADADLAQVESAKTQNGSFKLYASNFVYTAAGAVSSIRLGNGRWESTQFNSRLQPIQIALGTSQGMSNQFKLNYDYGTSENNGNVKSQQITVQRSNQSPLVFNQTYTYDSLNRLKQAVEMTGTTENWKQTYKFDRFGNRQFDTTNNGTTTLPQNFNANIYNPTIEPNNNKFTTGQGYTYDLSGNILTDAEGRSFTYDAENKQKTASNTGGSLGTYFYDGDGKRVKKVTNLETVIFVYDIFGKLIAEYSTQLSQTPQTQYLTNDNLGTPRINTDGLGAVVSRSDYMPYGEEIIGLGNRTSNEKYLADDIKQGFAGYIKDEETDLDFANDRFYSSKLGRFSSTDNVLLSELRVYNPQIWNSYSYVGNNPLRFSDPTGMERIELGESEADIQSNITTEEAKKKALEASKNALKKQKKSLSKDEYEKQKAAINKDIDSVNKSISTLETKLAGTIMVNAILKKLGEKNLQNGLKLTDFSLSTDPNTDFGVNIDEDNSNAFVMHKNGKPDYGGEIFINTQGPLFQGALNGDSDGTKQDWILTGAATFRHEQWHRDAPTHQARISEKLAYNVSYLILKQYQHDFSSGSSLYNKRMAYFTQRKNAKN